MSDICEPDRVAFEAEQFTPPGYIDTPYGRYRGLDYEEVIRDQNPPELDEWDEAAIKATGELANNGALQRFEQYIEYRARLIEGYGINQTVRPTDVRTYFTSGGMLLSVLQVNPKQRVYLVNEPGLLEPFEYQHVETRVRQNSGYRASGTTTTDYITNQDPEIVRVQLHARSDVKFGETKTLQDVAQGAAVIAALGRVSAVRAYINEDGATYYQRGSEKKQRLHAAERFESHLAEIIAAERLAGRLFLKQELADPTQYLVDADEVWPALVAAV